MRIRRHSEFAKSYYLKEVCILNQNPRDILGPWCTESQFQTAGENDDFCGMASFGKTVKDLLRETIPTKKGKDKKTENKPVVHCSFTDASGFKCDVKAKAGSQYCKVHVKLPKTSKTCSAGISKSSEKKVNRQLKRKKVELTTPGDEMVYYAGFPGLRRKRGCPLNRSKQAAAVNKVDESG